MSRGKNRVSLRAENRGSLISVHLALREGIWWCPGTVGGRIPGHPGRPDLIYVHVCQNSVQQMVSGGLAGEVLQTGFSRHCLPPQRAPLDTVYPLREQLNSVQRMVSGGYCEGLFPDTVCWTRLRNTWYV